MNHTKNYGLPQWELNDLIRMEDFNSAMEKIESGLVRTEQRDNSLSNRVDAAKALAEQLPYATGTYQGAGEQSLEITIGFKPSFLLIFANQGASDPTHTIGRICAVGRMLNNGRVTLLDTGFRVAPYDAGTKYPYVNHKGMMYQFIAFK